MKWQILSLENDINRFITRRSNCLCTQLLYNIKVPTIKSIFRFSLRFFFAVKLRKKEYCGTIKELGRTIRGTKSSPHIKANEVLVSIRVLLQPTYIEIR